MSRPWRDCLRAKPEFRSHRRMSPWNSKRERFCAAFPAAAFTLEIIKESLHTKSRRPHWNACLIIQYSLFLFRQHFPHRLHKLGARYHHVMPAAAATQTEIHTRAGNFPVGRTAGVRLLHPHDIAHVKFSFCIHFYFALPVVILVTLKPASRISRNGHFFFTRPFGFTGYTRQNIDALVGKHFCHFSQYTRFIGSVDGNTGCILA